MNEFGIFFDGESKDGICAVIYASEKYDIVEDAGEGYFCFPFWGVLAERSAYWLCVRKSALPKKGKVRFKVAEDMIGRVIGTGGRNIKKVAEALRLYITVEAVKI